MEGEGVAAMFQAATIIRLMTASTGMKSATFSALTPAGWDRGPVRRGHLARSVLISPVPIPAMVRLGPLPLSVQPEAGRSAWLMVHRTWRRLPPASNDHAGPNYGEGQSLPVVLENSLAQGLRTDRVQEAGGTLVYTYVFGRLPTSWGLRASTDLASRVWQ